MTRDRDRIEDADHVLHGPDGSGLVGRVLYAVYVTAFLALIYAYTVLRAVLVSSDTVWIRAAFAGWQGAAVGAGTLGLLAWGAWWLGGRRGPATPPLPWVDHVVASSIDRAESVRPWWRAALLGVSGCSAVLGGVLAAAVYAAGLAPPAAVPLGVVAGGALAAALCWLWLLAQARASRRQADPPALPPRAALRALALDDLRAHARRSQRLHGAVLSGDPRAARLQVASPIRRGRGLRLRPGRPLLTLVRRDLLGLRRQPGSALAGAVLSVIGLWLCSATALDSTTPIPVTVLGVGLAHLAVGQWAQGLRYAADGLSSSAVLGGSPARRALAHSVVPLLSHVALALPVAVVAWLVAGRAAPAPALLCALAALGLLLVGGHWWSAFRVAHPEAAFVPEMGPFLLALAVARPWLVVLAAGTVALQRLAEAPLPWLSVLALAAVGLGTLWRGRALLRQLVSEGR